MNAIETRRGPLRQIVAEKVAAGDLYSRKKVLLTCGHEVWCAGATIYRTRCAYCRSIAKAST